MLIQHGTVLSPGNKKEFSADLRIADGKIKETGNLRPLDGEEVIDASGCMVAPGLIDVHVHFRDPGFTYKEDLHTGACAAAAGGFTAVVCMANTRPVVDCPEVLLDILNRASREKIRILQTASVTKNLAGRELTDFRALAEAGACGFTDDGIPLRDEALVTKAMEMSRELGLPLSFHEEDPCFIRQSGAHATAPSIAEDILVARDCMLALHTGAAVSIQHISSKNSVAMVRTAKALGANVYAEATPHHFSLTEEALKEHGTLAKMNPPLRTEEDRQAIIEGLRDGTIDMIVTDHAPHSAEEKAKPFAQAPSGIIGLETSLALGITNLVRPGHLSMLELMEKMSANPAGFYHLPYGTVAEGTAADLVIFDPGQPFCPLTWHSKAANSPFTGSHLFGTVKYTVCRGEIVYRK